MSTTIDEIRARLASSQAALPGDRVNVRRDQDIAFLLSEIERLKAERSIDHMIHNLIRWHYYDDRRGYDSGDPARNGLSGCPDLDSLLAYVGDVRAQLESEGLALAVRESSNCLGANRISDGDSTAMNSKLSSIPAG